MDALKPAKTTANDPRVRNLIETHLELMRASSPACSVHAMEADDLADAGAALFAVFENEVAVAMGALKVIEPRHGELKSMHVAATKRGHGLADLILEALLSEARSQSLNRVSLETGSRPVFEPAVRFYTRHGFEKCDPFLGYEEDPESIFMTRTL